MSGEHASSRATRAAAQLLELDGSTLLSDAVCLAAEYNRLVLELIAERNAGLELAGRLWGCQQARQQAEGEAFRLHAKLGAHHAVGVLADAVIGEPCPVCARFDERYGGEV